MILVGMPVARMDPIPASQGALLPRSPRRDGAIADAVIGAQLVLGEEPVVGHISKQRLLYILN
jgi:hypothetical protein